MNDQQNWLYIQLKNASSALWPSSSVFAWVDKNFSPVHSLWNEIDVYFYHHATSLYTARVHMSIKSSTKTATYCCGYCRLASQQKRTIIITLVGHKSDRRLLLWPIYCMNMSAGREWKQNQIGYLSLPAVIKITPQRIHCGHLLLLHTGKYYSPQIFISIC